MIQKNYSRWKVGIWGLWKKKFNIWACWIRKEMNGQNYKYNVIYKQAPPHPPQKQAIFTVLWHIVEAQRLPEACQLHLQKWRSIIFSGYSSHIKYSFSATNWRYMQKSCECTWPQWQNLSSTYGQVKFPRKSPAIEAAHSLRHALH
jgi:hypothetical protein